MTGCGDRAALPNVKYSFALVSFDRHLFVRPIGAVGEGVHAVLELGKVLPWEPFFMLIEQIVSMAIIS
jgi:hypothetical protein